MPHCKKLCLMLWIVCSFILWFLASRFIFFTFCRLSIVRTFFNIAQKAVEMSHKLKRTLICHFDHVSRIYISTKRQRRQFVMWQSRSIHKHTAVKCEMEFTQCGITRRKILLFFLVVVENFHLLVSCWTFRRHLFTLNLFTLDILL